MSTWTDQAFLFSKIFHDLISDHTVGLIDCGARDNIPEPWASFEKAHPNFLKVLGFEADVTEAARLNKTNITHRSYVAAAAWNSIGHHALYLTHPPQASSLFPPNDALGHMYARSGDQMITLSGGRLLDRVVDVPTTTIDAALKTHPLDADILKIDTQGAEYEILDGAQRTLNDDLFAVIAETWTVDVYKGIHLAWDVMKLMADQGYVFITQDIAGHARRSFADAKTLAFLQREQTISLELLFFKAPDAVVKKAKTPAKIYKAVAISDAYGLPDYGVELLAKLLTRWPHELANVQKAYDEIAARRGFDKGVTHAQYPALNGNTFVKI